MSNLSKYTTFRFLTSDPYQWATISILSISETSLSCYKQTAIFVGLTTSQYDQQEIIGNIILLTLTAIMKRCNTRLHKPQKIDNCAVPVNEAKSLACHCSLAPQSEIMAEYYQTKRTCTPNNLRST